MPTSAAQIRDAFADWVTVPPEEYQPGVWHEHFNRAVTVLSAGGYCRNLLRYVRELHDPAYGIAAQLTGDYGVEQAKVCGLLKEEKYEEIAASAPTIAELFLRSLEDPDSVDLGDIGEADMRTINSIGIVQVNFSTNLTGVMRGALALSSMVCLCTYELLTGYFLTGGMPALESVLGEVSSKMAAVLNE